jgi:hypothetical protein
VKELEHFYFQRLKTRMLPLKLRMGKLPGYIEVFVVAGNSIHVVRHPKGEWVAKNGTSRGRPKFLILSRKRLLGAEKQVRMTLQNSSFTGQTAT